MARHSLAQFALIAIVGVLAATLISWQGAPDPRPVPLVLAATELPWLMQVPFRAQFVGVDRDAQTLSWRTSGDGGPATFALCVRQVADPARAADHIWRIEGSMDAETGSWSTSFSADVEGSLDWRTGMMRLEGMVRGGSMADHRVRIEARVEDLDLRGMVLTERVAASH
jgi:hypothetical protein